MLLEQHKTGEIKPIKDILDKLNTDRYIIASNKRTSKKKFEVTTKVQSVAQYAWETLEPHNPQSFDFYLYASHRLDSGLIYQLVSEIKNDPTVRNKGKLFVHKVKSYLSGR